jgi:soluble P-type ATPase
MDSAGNGTGKITKSNEEGIRTGLDKLREMKRGLENVSDSVTVYIGNSNTDLPCMLDADIGIIIGDNGSLIETCRRVGIVVKYGATLKDVAQNGRKETDLILYQFSDWHAVIESGLLD